MEVTLNYRNNPFINFLDGNVNGESGRSASAAGAREGSAGVEDAGYVPESDSPRANDLVDMELELSRLLSQLTRMIQKFNKHDGNAAELDRYYEQLIKKFYNTIFKATSLGVPVDKQVAGGIVNIDRQMAALKESGASASKTVKSLGQLLQENSRREQHDFPSGLTLDLVS